MPWLTTITCRIIFSLFIRKLTTFSMSLVIVKIKTFLLLVITLSWFFKQQKSLKNVMTLKITSFLKRTKTFKHCLIWKKIKWIFPLIGGIKRNISVTKSDILLILNWTFFIFCFSICFNFLFGLFFNEQF